MKKIILVNAAMGVRFALFALALASCHSGADWYPVGVAEISSSYEVEASGQKSCVATIKVTNSGLSRISVSTISVKATTDLRSYLRSVVSTVTVLPGASMYFDMVIPYPAATETLVLGSLQIVDQYYQ